MKAYLYEVEFVNIHGITGQELFENFNAEEAYLEAEDQALEHGIWITDIQAAYPEDEESLLEKHGLS